MLRTLLRDTLLYGASTVLTRAVSLALVPIYTRLLAPSEYGAIDILSIFGNLVTLTVALEIGQAVARFLPDAAGLPDRRRLVSTAAIFSTGAYSVFLLVGLLALEPLRQFVVGDEVTTGTVAIALFSIWAIGTFQMVQNVLRFSLRPVAFTLSGLAFSGVGMAVSIVLVVALGAGVAGVFAGQLVGGILGAGVAVWAGRDLYGGLFSLSLLRNLLAFSIPFVPASLGVFVTLYIDRIALNQLASLSAVGVFGIGYRLAALISLLLLGFQMALTPLIYQRYREPSTPRDLARIFRTFVAIAAFAALLLSIWAPEILRIATAPAYFPAAEVVPLLVPAVLLANMYVFMPGLAIAKRTRTIAMITISGAVMNTTLNVMLIPVLGIRGAALATLLSAIAVFVAYARASQATYPVPHDWRRIGLLAFGYAGLVIIGVSIGSWTVPAVAIKLAISLALVGWVFATRVVTPREALAVAEGLRRFRG